MNISELWRRITSSRRAVALEAAAHTERALKEEIARLRAENRALLNSILGIAGVPPITVVGEPAAVAPRLGATPADSQSDVATSAPKRDFPQSHPGHTKRASGTSGPHNDTVAQVSHRQTKDSAQSAGTQTKNGAQMAVPTRRRSWHQINRMLEFEAAKKKEQVVGGSGELTTARVPR